MQEEINEILDAAIYKEIASEALYLAARNKTADAGAGALLQQLAEEEARHTQWLTALKDKGTEQKWRQEVAIDLKISEHLSAPASAEGAGLQDTLIFAMKREQQSIEFYSKMTGMFRSRAAKRLCQKLAGEELRHKLKLEILYDDLFLGED